LRRHLISARQSEEIMDPITLAALAAFPKRLEAFYSLVPDRHKNWCPASWDGVPSEPFTPIEQVCHVKDIEIDGYHVRLRRTLDESNPLLASLDGEVLARERSYSTADTRLIFAQFREARSKTIELVAKLTPLQLRRAAEFEGHRVTLRGLVHNLCSHDQQHLAGMQWLLGRMAASMPEEAGIATSSDFQPAGWHTVTPRIIVNGAEALVGFVKSVFGATGEYDVRAPAELRVGDSVIMVSDAGVREPMTACLYVYVENADITWQRALEAGAQSIEAPLDTPYGDRRGMVKDPWGNTWQIATGRVRTAAPG
jgi:uncharacterized glyoxalase superfamily protein PhnB